MTARTQGMDTDEARQYSRGMDSHAQGVGQMFGTLSTRISGLDWKGGDFARFRDDMQTFGTEVNGACRSLEDNAARMRLQADAQDATSA